MNKEVALVVCMASCLSVMADGWDASLADFPRQAGEGDDSARIQRLIDANASGTVYLPKGEYLVSMPLIVTNACSIEMNKGAVLKAIAKMPFVLTVENFPAYAAIRARKEPIRDYGLFVRGGCIDGNGLASCMSLVRFRHYTMNDMVFLNGREFGLRVSEKSDSSYELIANNLYFKCTMSGLSGNVALCTTGGDSHYTDCVVVDYTVGFKTKGGSNRFTRCHVWGGPIPPMAKGEIPEMLKNSVCFWIAGSGDSLRDCYADTGKTGFRIEGDVQMFGCWYFNNTGFGLDDITIIDHRRGRLLVSGGKFSKDSRHVKVYSAASPLAEVAWRDMTYQGFDENEQLGVAEWCKDPVMDAYDQECSSPDDWELLQQGTYVFSSVANEFDGAVSCRKEMLYVSVNRLLQKFPALGPGRDLVIRCRATCPETRRVEVALSQQDGRVWGLEVPLTSEWREVRVPLSQLRYFSHWGGVPPEAGKRVLDRRKLKSICICFGRWLCPQAVDKSHGFEISSIRVVK